MLFSLLSLPQTAKAGPGSWETLASVLTHHPERVLAVVQRLGPVAAGFAGPSLDTSATSGLTPSMCSVRKPVNPALRDNPVMTIWKSGPAMPTPRGPFAVAVLSGDEDGTTTAAVDVLAPSITTWSIKAFPAPPRDHPASAIAGDTVYTISGQMHLDDGKNLAVTERDDPFRHRWGTMAPMPTTSRRTDVGVIAGTIFVIGGEGWVTTKESCSPASGLWREDVSMPRSRQRVEGGVVRGALSVTSIGPRSDESFSHVTERDSPLPVLPTPSSLTRSSPQLVGTIMALLATFREAGALPEEHTREANQLIKALIQFQSAFRTGDGSEIRTVLHEALVAQFGAGSRLVLNTFLQSGWTSRTLEAVVDFDTTHDLWRHPELIREFKLFNIGREDWVLVSRVFQEARARLASEGASIHTVYARHRQEMLGGTPPPQKRPPGASSISFHIQRQDGMALCRPRPMF